MVKHRVYDLSSYDVTFTPQYDDYGRIERLTTMNTESTPKGVDFEYAYDDNGNITDQTYHHRPSTPNTDYGYDALNRLTTADYLGATGQTFNYDLLGNRNSVTDSRSGGVDYTYGDNNVVNEYEKINSATQNVFHDDNGNLTTDHRGYGYHYDYENRLECVYLDDDGTSGYTAGDTKVAQYSYDALGRRIEMVAYNNSVTPAASTATRYYYDDQRVLAETDYNSGTQVETDKRHFVYGNYIDEVLVMYKFLSPTVKIRYYYAHDHLYSPVAVFSYSGALHERYEYDAYGEVTIWDATFSTICTASSCQNPYTFTGRRLDLLDPNGSGGYQLKLMDYRARSGRAKNPLTTPEQ